MKIVFLCGSLEPGRDGVGDYTRQLAIELIRQRHQVKLIAIADKHIKVATRQIQNHDGISIQVTRVPLELSYKMRLPIVKEEIANERPDWLSLQFVIFSFQPKGIPIGLRKFLRAIGTDCKWHIMFHELWLGMERTATVKHKIWGAIQLAITKSILFTLKPKVIHTQAGIYKAQLSKLGISPKLLPLFSNIPVRNQNTTAFSAQVTKERKTLSLIMFGSIHPGAPVAEFADEARRYGNEYNRHVILIIVGRAGEEEKRWLTISESAGLEVKLKGEQPEEEISNLFQSSDFGITTNPITLIEKSGTVAAMLAHGLPVISVSKPWIPKENISQNLPGISEFRPGNLKVCFSKKKGEPNPDMLAITAKQMILDLQLK